MALTGGRIIASIYRINQYDIKNVLGTPATQGVIENLPGNLCRFYPAPANTTANGVTMNAIIDLLPTGLNQPVTKYYTDSTVAQINTNGS